MSRQGYLIDDDYDSRSEDEFQFRKKVSSIGETIKEFREVVNQTREISDKIKISTDINLVEALQSKNEIANDLAASIGKEIRVLASMRSTVRVDQRVRESHIEKLTNQFSAILRQFQLIQKNAQITERETLSEAKRQSEFANLFRTDFGQQAQVLEEKQEFIPLEEIQEREKAIKKIEQDIIGVNNIMKDLAVMIHEQGDIVDNIESHIETTHNLVENANTELSKAKTYQGRARRKKCIIICILSVISAVIIIFLIFKYRK